MGGTHPPGGTLAERRAGKATFVVETCGAGRYDKNPAPDAITRSSLQKLFPPFF